MGHSDGDEVDVHSEIVIKATVHLDVLKPSDVSVQVYYGRIDDGGTSSMSARMPMELSGDLNGKRASLSGTNPVREHRKVPLYLSDSATACTLMPCGHRADHLGIAGVSTCSSGCRTSS